MLNRDFSTEKQIQKLCLDITYIKVNKPSPKWVYLCAVKDLYNNEIVAYDVSSSQNMMQVFRVLNQLTQLPLSIMPFYTQTNDSNLQMRVAYMGLIQSMSRRGNCWDNACIKNFFRHLKAEMLHFSTPKTLKEMAEAISEYINYYSHKRVQLKYGMSPSEFRRHAA